MKRQKYQDILKSLSELDHWLSNLGIRIQYDRLHRHLQNIRYLAELVDTKNTHKLSNDQKIKISWSLVEATEFQDIYPVIRNYSSKHPELVKQKVKDALKGPADSNSESTSSNIGRNTVFELNLATRLMAKNIPVRLSKNPDILCSINGRDIFIQCKRPFWEKNIPVNISCAKSQLTRDLNQAETRTSSRGIIAISISRALNKGDMLFIGRGEANMLERLTDDVESLGNKYKRTWSKIVDTRIIGILFHIITPSFIGYKLITIKEHEQIIPATST
ncbi:MAG TPA: hypothetical protein ENN18_07245 [Proteobacteria bacterium]|nr:hypothetical protein [Pseudomonadota bacterium]